MSREQAVIVGAGPAGLTAAYELLDRTDVVPLLLEQSDFLGGISRTANYHGNRIDLGGHRFFSKSDRVMKWWLQKIPLQKLASAVAAPAHDRPSGGGDSQGDGPDPATTDRVMLVRTRKSRIYFLRRFFDYPLRLNFNTVANLGPIRMANMARSYAWAVLSAGRKPPENLEEFLIRRFGRELYLTFFKSYTEKVWGESCARISAEWGEQRIKGLSISKAVLHFLKSGLSRKNGDLGQKATETSLIERFLYPKFGPGQMWETVADAVAQRGGKILLKHHVTQLHVHGDRVTGISAVDTETGRVDTFRADYTFSTMPMSELVEALDANMPENVRAIARGLVYRDFITVGLLVTQLKVREEDGTGRRPISDNWIYIQEPEVRLGRLQIFNNWSPYMVADPALTWIGLEYFCRDTDDLWNLPDQDMIDLAKTELAQIGILDAADVRDATVLRMPKAYPAYFGTYDRLGEVRTFTDRFANLFLIGRNGMHKYNNQDHSMLTAMTAVDNLVAGRTDKANIWEVNTEQEYHERQRVA